MHIRHGSFHVFVFVWRPCLSGRATVAHAVSCLPEKERVSVTLYYMQGVTLKEIGEILGVTESRACQLRSQGVKRLKFRLRGNMF